MMGKLVGYIIAFIGLITLALGLEIFNIGSDFLNGFSKWYVTVFGSILIGVGVVFSLMNKNGSRRSSKSEEEVPIYEGTGKKRKIVGYRKG